MNRSGIKAALRLFFVGTSVFIFSYEDFS